MVKEVSFMIKVENLSKEFKMNKKYPGFKGAIKSFFSREYTTKVAVDSINFEINEKDHPDDSALFELVIKSTYKIFYNKILYAYIYENFM